MRCILTDPLSVRFLSPSPNVATLDDDPFSAGVLSDPYAFHQRMRDAGGVVWLDRYGVFALSRYTEVRAALRDWQRFSSGAGVGLDNLVCSHSRPRSLVLEDDPPEHDAPRSVLSSLLSSRELVRLRASWFVQAEALIDSVLSGTGSVVEFDAVAELARAFPLRVFPDAVGLGKAGRGNLLSYAEHSFNEIGPQNELFAASLAADVDSSVWVNAQTDRAKLDSEGFGTRIWSAADRGDVTPEQARLLVRALLAAGLDTTVNGIGAALLALATNPAQWARLRQQPRLAGVAFEEAIRWESPVQTFMRTTTKDLGIGPVTIPSGSKVMLFFGAANRDPRRWSAPDVYDLGRDPSGHVGFGMGIHQCVGQHVARLEAEAVLTVLATRVKSITLSESPTRHFNNVLRGLDKLPVRVTRA